MTRKFNNLLFSKKLRLQRMVYDNVKVAVRVRPINREESRTYLGESVVKVGGEGSAVYLKSPLRIISRTNRSGLRTFVFDAVFPPRTKQLEIYNRMAKPIVRSVMRGFNGTIFTYGQTGSGKTFTMTGDGIQANSKGIVNYSFQDIFRQISDNRAAVNYDVRVSYLEIYKEHVIDLLEPNKSFLDILENSQRDVYVRNLSSHRVTSLEEVQNFLQLGNGHRTVGATVMNERSSRSHTIFTVKVEQSHVHSARGSLRVRTGKLHLVDLAGSERLSKSTGGAGGCGSQREAITINQSLSTLGNVISALVHSRCRYIPYRDSKLTRLLQDSLGGNSQTVMLATISPSGANYEETVNTLRYAHRAKRIQNNVQMNEEATQVRTKTDLRRLEYRATKAKNNYSARHLTHFSSVPRMVRDLILTPESKSSYRKSSSDLEPHTPLYISTQSPSSKKSASAKKRRKTNRVPLEDRMKAIDELFIDMQTRLKTAELLVHQVINCQQQVECCDRPKRSRYLTRATHAQQQNWTTQN